jgi:hypothetical protein
LKLKQEEIDRLKDEINLYTQNGLYADREKLSSVGEIRMDAQMQKTSAPRPYSSLSRPQSAISAAASEEEIFVREKPSFPQREDGDKREKQLFSQRGVVNTSNGKKHNEADDMQIDG